MVGGHPDVGRTLGHQVEQGAQHPDLGPVAGITVGRPEMEAEQLVGAVDEMHEHPPSLPHRVARDDGRSVPGADGPEPWHDPRVPRLAPTGLPVESHVGEITDALAGRRRVVLVAEPGAGKTTVLPLRLLEAPWLAGERIVVLEPRRVAARAAARRMAALLGEHPGETVGWRTRDDHRVGPGTRVEVVTDGILAARLRSDPALSGVGLVVFDEFHERSLPADTALALTLKGLGEGRVGARLLVMSATLDAARLTDHLDATLVEVPGRSHPVEVRWRPRRRRRDELVASVAAAVDEALAAGGDVLVFCPGAGEIERIGAGLRQRHADTGLVVAPLHGGLPAEQQDRALVPDPDGRRRVVLATDLAETSLTVDGVSAVVDLGLARRPRFDPASGLTRLVTEPVTRDSADQRAGRAGRQGPGIAIRLWAKLEHGSRPRHREPAITREDLAGLVLELAGHGVTDPDEVPFVDPPPAEAWRAGRDLLGALGALDEGGGLTPTGTAMADLPVHPRLARMLTGARHPWMACLVAALLDERDVLRGAPRDLPADIGLRVRLLLDAADHPALDDRSVERIRRRAGDLARRLGVEPDDGALREEQLLAAGAADLDEALGGLLLAAYPDRVYRARAATPGHFVALDGPAVRVGTDDALASAAGIVVATRGGTRGEPTAQLAARLEARLDHLVYATPDLDATVADVVEQWGVTPSPGGSHVGLGTRNVLLGLGDGAYLEIIGPDPDQGTPAGPRPFGIDELGAPRLVTWALRVPDLDHWLAWMTRRGVDPGPAIDMSRARPDGTVLRWRLTPPRVGEGGVLPFLIEWPGPTPAAELAPATGLLELVVSHPDRALASRLREYATPHTVQPGPAGLRATLMTPHGLVTLGG